MVRLIVDGTYLENNGRAPVFYAGYASLWAEQAIVRSYQRLIDTARRLGYIEDGRRRLDYLRETDPAEQKRFREKLDAMQRMLAQP